MAYRSKSPTPRISRPLPPTRVKTRRKSLPPSNQQKNNQYSKAACPPSKATSGSFMSRFSISISLDLGAPIARPNSTPPNAGMSGGRNNSTSRLKSTTSREPSNFFKGVDISKVMPNKKTHPGENRRSLPRQITPNPIHLYPDKVKKEKGPGIIETGSKMFKDVMSKLKPKKTEPEYYDDDQDDGASLASGNDSIITTGTMAYGEEFGAGPQERFGEMSPMTLANRLKQKGFDSRTSDLFLRNKISGHNFLSITDLELKEIGVRDPKIRKSLISARKNLLN